MRGQKYSDEIKEKAYMLYAVNGNIREAARQLGLPFSTVKTWIKNKPKDELDKLRGEKRKDIIKAAAEDIKDRQADFIERSSRVIDLSLDVLEWKLQRALDGEENNITVNQLSSAIGTLYDKRALAKGESTQNTAVTVKLPEDVMRYAE